MTTPTRRLAAFFARDEWVGLLVLIAVVGFTVAVLQAGVLREWVAPSARLRVLLPDEGVSGLAAGAELEVLGTRAGVVRRVVISPGQRLFADVALDNQARDFIRRDSTATIRRRFGVAGAAYLDVTRGTGAPLDWDFAVIEAVSDRAPTETVGALIDEARDRILPIIEDAGRIVRALANTVERIERGEGTIGRLVSDEELARQVDGILGEANGVLEAVRRVVDGALRITGDGERVAAALAGPQGVPALLRRSDQVMADIQRLSRELARAAPRTQNIARGLEQSVQGIPPVLLQAQATARELEALTAQLRALWLLGGRGPEPPRERLPAERVRP
jgi:phospholipid/cholesterol/gamma-HCH transport system substrate-binding protein